MQRHQERLDKSMKGSDVIFHSADLLNYKFHRISLNRSGSYIVSPNSLINNKATIDPRNNDDKCFQYAVSTALNYEQIKKDPKRI